MRRILLKIIKSLIIGVVAVILVAVGIDASEHYDNMSESILGRMIFGASDGPCAEGMVFVPTENNGFCIDVYEASPGASCINESVAGQSETSANLNDIDCKPVSKPQAESWRYISQSQAAAACAKAGKRLPSDEELYLASLGTPDPSTDWAITDCQVDSNWDTQPGLTGSGENCVSGMGAFDMIGNVWEWVRGEARDGKLNNKPLPNQGYIKSVDSAGMAIETDNREGDNNYNNDFFWIKTSGIRGLARGGYWDNKADAGVYAMYLVSPPNFAGTGVGFRCAK